MTLVGKKQEILFLLITFCSYFPFIFLGPGTDNDTYRVINLSIYFDALTYQPSRTPGYLVHEVITYVLYKMGGSVLSNLGTVLMSLIIIYVFLEICNMYSIQNKFLLASLFAYNPIYFVNSTVTIDYLYAIALFSIGFILFEKKNYYQSSIFFGLSVGARLSSIIFVGIFFIIKFIYLMKTKENLSENDILKKKIVIASIFSFLIAGLCYVPSFIWAGYSLDFLTYSIGDWSLLGYIARFIYKNLYFFGVQGLLLFFIILIIFRKNMKEQISKNKFDYLFVLSILIFIAFEIFFLKVPIEKEYLLPILPFVSIILGRLFPNNRIVLILLLIAVISYNFISINIELVDISDTQNFEFGIWFESGYLLNNIYSRISNFTDGMEHTLFRIKII